MPTTTSDSSRLIRSSIIRESRFAGLVQQRNCWGELTRFLKNTDNKLSDSILASACCQFNGNMTSRDERELPKVANNEIGIIMADKPSKRKKCSKAVVQRAKALQAEHFLLSGGETNIQEGLSLLRSCAEAKDMYASFLLCRIYESGLFGVEQNQEEARIFKEMCEKGNFLDADLLLMPIGKKEELKPGNPQWDSLSCRLRFNTVDIKTLELRDNNIGNDGTKTLCEALKTNKILTLLNLRTNNIGIEGAKALTEMLLINTTLTALNIPENRIQNTGAEILSEVLRKNTSLKSMDLSTNGITDEGAIKLSEGGKNNTTLTQLLLWNNNIGEKSSRLLNRMREANGKLNMNLSDKWIEQEAFKLIIEARKKDPTISTQDQLRRFLYSTGEKMFNERMKNTSDLITLHFWGNKFGEERARMLSETLKTNTTAKTLNLWQTAIGEEDADTIREGLKENTTLTTLHLWTTILGDKGAEFASQVMNENKSLTTIHLWSMGITPIGAKMLGEALKTNTILKALHLWSNNIGDEGTKAICEGLKKNTTLVELNLGRNGIGNEGAKMLAETLAVNSSLTILNLYMNDVRDEGARKLFDIKVRKGSLAVLNLRFNRIRYETEDELGVW